MTSSGGGDAETSGQGQATAAGVVIAAAALHADRSDESLYRAYVERRAQDAFSELVRRHRAMVLCVARRVTGGGDDADDVLQAAFLALADHAHAGKPILRLASWLHRVARNLATHRRDAAAARKRHEREAGMSTPRVQGVDTEAEADAESAGRIKVAMDQALTELPERYRQPLILHYLEGRSFAEIAHALDTSTGTVASWLSRGRALLRARLARLGHPVTAATLALALSDLVHAGGGASGVEALDPGRLGSGSHGAAIRDLATHAQPAVAATWWLAGLACAATAMAALVAWQVATRAAPEPERAPTPRAIAQGQPAEPARLIDIDHAGIAYYNYLSVDRQTPAEAAALVARLPLAQVGSWPTDQPDPWALPRDPEQQGMPYRRGDETLFLSRLGRGEVRLPPARAGARAVIAIGSDAIAANQRWGLEQLSLRGEDIQLDLSRWDLEPTPGAPDHRYLFLLDLGVLPAGAHTLEVIEHARGDAHRCLRSACMVRIAAAGATSVAKKAPAAVTRASLVEAADPEPARAYCESHQGIIGAQHAPPVCGLIAAGGLPSGDPLHAPLDLAGLPEPVPPTERDDMRCVVVCAASSTVATTLRVRALLLQERGARLVVESWTDPSAPPVAPRAATLLVAFARGPQRIELEWHELTREADGGFSDRVEPAPGGWCSCLPVPERF